MIIGKYTPVEIADMLKDGKIESEDYWWMGGMKEWVKVSVQPPTTSSRTVADDSNEKLDQEEFYEDSLKNWRELAASYQIYSSGPQHDLDKAAWDTCPPRELVTPTTQMASERQLVKIHEFIVRDVPSNLTKNEASVWIDKLLKSDNAQKVRKDDSLLYVLAAEILKKTRSKRSVRNKKNLTNKIITKVIWKVKCANEQLFTLKNVHCEFDVMQKFIHEEELSNLLYDQLSKDYPGCVDGGTPNSESV